MSERFERLLRLLPGTERRLLWGGGALLGALLVGVLALSWVARRARNEARAHAELLRARYAAEAGLTLSLVELGRGDDGELGSADEPRALGEAEVHVSVEERSGGLLALTATAALGGERARTRLVVQTSAPQDLIAICA